MLDHTPYPPRREPRLLLVTFEPAVSRCLAMDAWEIRAMSLLPRDEDLDASALWRLIVRAHPSHVLVHHSRRWVHSRALPMLREIALRAGLPFGILDHQQVLGLARKAPELPQLLEQYPELRHLVRGPRDPWVRAARVALGTLSTRSLPPRRYAPDHPPHPESSLGR